MSIESVIPSNHLILCCPLLLPPSIFPSFRVFSNESVLHIMWPKYWSFSLNISPSNEYSGLISFGIDWLDLPAVQGTLKSVLQHHSSKALILLCSAFFTVQLSHSYITKKIRDTKGTFHAKMGLIKDRSGMDLTADQLRQHIKKQRHNFDDKGLYSQSYGFSSSHVWMWELDYKESWVLKNWCFWTVVLEKTLESPLDCKEIKAFNPKGNQSWIFI